MAYSNQHNSNRPFELASKASHSQIINSPNVRQYLNHCRATGSRLPPDSLEAHALELGMDQPEIDYVIAVDSGSTTPIPNKDGTGKLSVVQFGVLLLSVQDFLDLDSKPVIGAEDLDELKRDRQYTLVLPAAEISYKNRSGLVDSLRLTIYEFLRDNDLIDTWEWLVYQKYRKPALAHGNRINFNRKCPKHARQIIKFKPGELMKKCPNSNCRQDVYTTDIFNFQSLANEEELPEKFTRNIVQLIETICLVRAIKGWCEAGRPIDRALFMLDGQLMVRDPTQPNWADRDKLTKLFRHFTGYMLKTHGLNLVGIEKSGPFVNYANKIAGQKRTKSPIKPGHYLILDEEIIRQEIIPSPTARSKPYGYYEHYGSKIIFRTSRGKLHVLTTPPWVANPKSIDFPNLESMLVTMDKLRCELYNNALIPITLANNAVSLSFKPGKDLLTKFIADYVSPAPKPETTDKRQRVGQVIQSPIRGLTSHRPTSLVSKGG